MSKQHIAESTKLTCLLAGATVSAGTVTPGKNLSLVHILRLKIENLNMIFW